MNAKRLLLPAVVSLALLAGCDNDQKKKDSTPTPPTPPAARPNTAAPTTQKAVEPAKPAVDAPKPAVTDTKAPVDATKAAADTAKEQGTKLMGDLNTAITSGKWTDADALIKQLDAMRDKLPADLQTKYDGLKKLYADTKAKVPAVPGLPK